MKNFRDNLLFLPLGGAGEIGMNCNLFHYNGKWIMIDLGIMFAESNDSPYELLMPDLEFLNDKKIKLDALILTHAHEDHIGAVPYLFDKIGKIPLYSTSFTASVLKRKFNAIKEDCYEIKILEYNKKIKIGDFEIEILALTHSIPEPNAIIIRTEKGNIFHTGDWKIDPTPLIGKPIDKTRLHEIKKEGIDVMICDSTNVFDEDPSGSENDVRKNLKEIFSHKKEGKIIITCFASNVARLDTILEVSNDFNRNCVLLGKSLLKIYESALENGYLDAHKNILKEKESQHIPDENLVLICTGSQGENGAALSRFINGENRYHKIKRHDTVMFSSRVIPGNEKKINELKAKIIKEEIQIIDHNNSKIHVSGHPSRKELKQMYEWINPRVLIPVHGEYQHLIEHKRFAEENGIPKSLIVENGDIVIMDKNLETHISKRVHSGKNVLKGNRVFSIEDKAISLLKFTNKEGEIFINLILNTENKMLSEPVIFCPTIFYDEEKINEIRNLISDNFSEISTSSYDDSILSEQIKSKVRNFIKKKIGLKPLIYVEIVRI